MPYAPSRAAPHANIHYRVHGDEGPALVLVHGLGLSSRFWFDIPTRLATDPDRPRRVITIDNRGTGRSDRPSRLWSIATMADDVAAVLDHAGVADASLLGISMGGMIAQQFAMRHPSRVRGLVLLATTPGFVSGKLPEPIALGRLLALPFGGDRAKVSLARLLLPESQWKDARALFRDWPQAMEEEPMRPGTFVAHLLAASMHFSARNLRRVACPTLVVAGRHDALIPVRNSEVIARCLPNAELCVLEDASHGIFVGAPERVCELVERLESKLDSSAA